jgi:hypothetical protein
MFTIIDCSRIREKVNSVNNVYYSKQKSVLVFRIINIIILMLEITNILSAFV